MRADHKFEYTMEKIKVFLDIPYNSKIPWFDSYYSFETSLIKFYKNIFDYQ